MPFRQEVCLKEPDHLLGLYFIVGLLQHAMEKVQFPFAEEAMYVTAGGG